VQSKEDFLAEFKDSLEEGNKGIGLRAFYMKVKGHTSPRALMTLLDDLNKRGQVVITALCWPVSGPAYRTIIKLPLTEWLALVSYETTKLYFFAETQRWCEQVPNTSTSAYSQFKLYVIECGLPDDVRAKLENFAC
jgi:hypothetical protein